MMMMIRKRIPKEIFKRNPSHTLSRINICTLLTHTFTGVSSPAASWPLDRSSLQIHLTKLTGGRFLLLTWSNVATR